MKKKTITIFLHPFLFALYPALFFYVQNQDEVKLYQAVRSLVLVVLASLILLFIARLINRSWQRAALVTTIGLMLFFLYNHIRPVIHGIPVIGTELFRHRYLLALWLVVFAALVWWSVKKLKDPRPVTQILNLVGVVLLVFLAIQIYQYQNRAAQVSLVKKQQQLTAMGLKTITKDLTPPKKLPDIYYIIMDGYSRADVLQSEFGYDNTAFIEALKQRGFYVAACSRSNYPKTAFSLGSSLNMQYWKPMGDSFFASGQRWQALGDWMRTNTVINTLEEMGYKTVAFDTIHSWANLSDASIFYSVKLRLSLKDYFPSGITEYEAAFLDTTMINGLGPVRKILLGLRPMTNPADTMDSSTLSQAAQDAGVSRYQYNMVSFDLDRFEQDVPGISGPKFVFAHILAVHVPFVFGTDGSFKPDESDQGYINSILYANKRMLGTLDKIIAQSSTPPLIIIQADHGRPTAKNEEAILNAYYLPGADQSQLYPTITPVNSFRIVFDQYFGAHLGLLDDHSYYVAGGPGTYEFSLTEADTCQP